MSSLPTDNSPKRPSAPKKSLGMDEWVAIIVALATFGPIFFWIVAKKGPNTTAVARSNEPQPEAIALQESYSELEPEKLTSQARSSDRSPKVDIEDFESQPKSISNTTTIPLDIEQLIAVPTETLGWMSTREEVTASEVEAATPVEPMPGHSAITPVEPMPGHSAITSVEPMSVAATPVEPMPGHSAITPVEPMPVAATPVEPMPGHSAITPVEPMSVAATPVEPMPGHSAITSVEPMSVAATPVEPMPGHSAITQVEPMSVAATPVEPMPGHSAITPAQPMSVAATPVEPMPGHSAITEVEPMSVAATTKPAPEAMVSQPAPEAMVSQAAPEAATKPALMKEYQQISPAKVKEDSTTSSKQPIALDSEEGERLLTSSSSLADYLPLAMEFLSENNSAYSGVASAVMVLNALEVPAPSAPGFAKQYRFFTQENVFDNPEARKILSPEAVSLKGMTLKQLTRFVRSYGVPAEAYYASDIGLDDFRQKLVEN
ncbi:MAG: phytochelatin synthase family protein, partial [Cyanobacteriota bacterium]|nr:phytochelatin synthase family protein [Cyanobacteriota bacterium]